MTPVSVVAWKLYIPSMIEERKLVNTNQKYQIYIFTIYLKIYMINFTFTYLHGYHLSSEGHHIYMLTCLQIYMANISILTWLTIVVKIYKLVTFVIPINRYLTFCNRGGCRIVSTSDTLSTRYPTVLRTVPSLGTLFRDNPNSLPSGWCEFKSRGLMRCYDVIRE